jgi:hypothetical protein
VGSVTFSSGAVITGSTYFKAAEYSKGILRFINSGDTVFAQFDLVAGTVGAITATGAFSGISATITPVNGGFYRVSLTVQTTGITTAQFRFLLVNSSGSSNFTGDGVSGLYVWGAQVEQGGIVTSYIPTYGTSKAVVDYSLSSIGLLNLATAPLVAAALTWTGSYTMPNGDVKTVSAKSIATGDGISTQFSIGEITPYNLAYGLVGGYGSLLMPYQILVHAYRPALAGIPNVIGYGGPAGGYSTPSTFEYGSLDMIEGAVTDADIYSAVDNVRAAGITAWVAITD